VVERDPDIIAIYAAIGVANQLFDPERGKIRIVEGDAFAFRPTSPVDLLMPDIDRLNQGPTLKSNRVDRQAVGQPSGQCHRGPGRRILLEVAQQQEGAVECCFADNRLGIDQQPGFALGGQEVTELSRFTRWASPRALSHCGRAVGTPAVDHQGHAAGKRTAGSQPPLLRKACCKERKSVTPSCPLLSG
jgi:hypothetical protein